MMKIDLVGDKNRGLAVGINEFAGYLSVGVVAFLTGYIANHYGVSPYPFYLGIGFSILGLLLSLLFVKDTRQHVSKENKTSPIPNLTNPFWDTTFRHKSLSAITQAGLTNNLNDGMAWGLFPLFFAGQPELRLDVVPMLVLVTALTVGAGVMALATRSYWLQLAAAAAGGVTLMVHVLASHRDPLGWLTAGLALAVAVAHYAVVERWGFLRRRSEREVSSPGAGNADSPGFDFHPAHAFLLFVVAALFAVLLAAERMLPGAAALTTLVLVLGATRVSAIGTLRFMGVLVAPLATFVMVVIHVAQGHHAGGPSELLWLALCLVPTVASQGGALLGASLADFAAVVLLRKTYTTFLHANLRWRLRGLERYVATPDYHALHHSHALADRDRNFAGMLPVLDRLFGTHAPLSR